MSTSPPSALIYAQNKVYDAQRDLRIHAESPRVHSPHSKWRRIAHDKMLISEDNVFRCSHCGIETQAYKRAADFEVHVVKSKAQKDVEVYERLKVENGWLEDKWDTSPAAHQDEPFVADTSKKRWVNANAKQ